MTLPTRGGDDLRMLRARSEPQRTGSMCPLQGMPSAGASGGLGRAPFVRDTAAMRPAACGLRFRGIPHMTRETENESGIPEADRLRELAEERDDDDPTGVLADVLADRVEQQAVVEAAEQYEQLAETAMTVADLRRADQEDLSAVEYLSEYHGVDVLEYETEAALLEAVRGTRDGSEQLGALGGDAALGSDAGGTLDGESEAAEQLAESVLNVSDLQRMEAADLSAREYLSESHGVDPAEYQTEEGLRRAIVRAEAEAAAGGAR